jgi:hypothetical protein
LGKTLNKVFTKEPVLTNYLGKRHVAPQGYIEIAPELCICDNMDDKNIVSSASYYSHPRIQFYVALTGCNCMPPPN